MTLNGEMALILRYFTELGSFRRTLRKSVRNLMIVASVIPEACLGH